MNRKLCEGLPVTPIVPAVIAEIGINHNGSHNVARQLIKEAFLAGVDFVKFQYRNLDNLYLPGHKEIGDEILEHEINRCQISVQNLISLVRYAKSLGVHGVGISFFNLEDVDDFKNEIELFDFFKIPSPEFGNLPLMRRLIDTKKPLFVSTGAQFEGLVEKIFKSLPEANWYPFHCVSNYPTKIYNAKLGYIQFLKEKYKKNVGYSSHDDDWRVCIAAIGVGARWIERHITLNKDDIGLDHSTSSTPEEFRELVHFVKSSNLMLSGNEPRTPNQGELLNLQNLGRSFYFKKNIGVGNLVTANDLVYRSPGVGIRAYEIDLLTNTPLVQDARSGQVLCKALFESKRNLSPKLVENTIKSKIALPVRLHDIESIRTRFPIDSFELHLSYRELASSINLKLFKSNEFYSIHVPDYISPTELINPFSGDGDVRRRSIEVFSRVKELARELFILTGKKIPIVSSLSIAQANHGDFYLRCKCLTSEWNEFEKGSFLTMQILPPVAWYFGGSATVDVFSSPDSWGVLSDMKIPVTLDLSHLIMSCNFYDYSLADAINLLTPISKHVHLSLARGFDGEGVDFSDPTDEEISALKEIIQLDVTKVIEVWQGHLNCYAGFEQALVDLDKLMGGGA